MKITTKDICQDLDHLQVVISGTVSSIKEVLTKSRNKIAYLTLTDDYGSVETMIFPDVYNKSKKILLNHNAIFTVYGSLDVSEDNIWLIASEIEIK
ncbi:MAG: OB-fold nucleic acid binding domain-containing protein [Smithellaceae bacterium]